MWFSAFKFWLLRSSYGDATAANEAKGALTLFPLVQGQVQARIAKSVHPSHPGPHTPIHSAHCTQAHESDLKHKWYESKLRIVSAHVVFVIIVIGSQSNFPDTSGLLEFSFGPFKILVFKPIIGNVKTAAKHYLCSLLGSIGHPASPWPLHVFDFDRKLLYQSRLEHRNNALLYMSREEDHCPWAMGNVQRATCNVQCKSPLLVPQNKIKMSSQSSNCWPMDHWHGSGRYQTRALTLTSIRHHPEVLYINIWANH